MSDGENTGASGSGNGSSAEVTTPGQVPPVPPVTPPTEPAKSVPLGEYKQALDRMHKAEGDFKALNERLEGLEAEKLKETSNFKALYEQTDAKLKAAQEESESLKSAFVRTQKYSAVKAAALAKGLRNEKDLELLDLEAVDVELIQNSNGVRFNVKGVDAYVDSLIQTRDHWFKPDGPPIVNPGGGSAPIGNGTLTPADVVKAERLYKMGKSTKEDYLKVYRDYDAQQKKTG